MLVRPAAFLFFLLFATLLASGLQAQGQREVTSPSPARGTTLTGAQKDNATSSLPELKPDAKGALTQQQMQDLFRVVATKSTNSMAKVR